MVRPSLFFPPDRKWNSGKAELYLTSPSVSMVMNSYPTMVTEYGSLGLIQNRDLQFWTSTCSCSTFICLCHANKLNLMLGYWRGYHTILDEKCLISGPEGKIFNPPPWENATKQHWQSTVYLETFSDKSDFNTMWVYDISWTWRHPRKCTQETIKHLQWLDNKLFINKNTDIWSVVIAIQYIFVII